MVAWYSNGSLNTRLNLIWYSNTGPFGNRTTFNHLKTGLVRYSDHHCIHYETAFYTFSGIGLYLGASVLDHSCQPNAAVVFQGKEIIVRCIQVC